MQTSLLSVSSGSSLPLAVARTRPRPLRPEQRPGSRCGTSPAWCLPFLNLELLYLRTLDRGWLEQLYPYASAFASWWLENRVDAEGWLVYKCTWEAGEDGNPRLDPTGSGNADIST